MANNEQIVKLAQKVISQNARDYVLAHGWKRLEQEKVKSRNAIFTHPGDDLDQLIIPIDEIVSDYGHRIVDIVNKLATIEERPPYEVLNDLLTPDSDILRFRIKSPETEKGILSLEEGIDLLEGAKRALLSAACSVVNPKTHHPRMSRTETDQLLDTCKLGQTEHGSYVVKIICPLKAAPLEESLLEGDLPFTRKTTSLLMRSANRLVRAIEADKPDTILDDKEKDMPIITSNFCEALLKMHRIHESSLSLSITWSRTFTNGNHQDIPSEVHFKENYFQVIETIYDKLRPSAEETKSQPFFGTVETLNGEVTDTGDRCGEVVLRIGYEEEMLKVHVILDAAQYKIADEAHMHNKYVTFEGTLHRGARRHIIKDLKDFNIHKR